MIHLLLILLIATTPSDLDKKTREIADQLRCAVCRGIAVSESPSELAQGMVKIIREKLEQGQTEEQILNYFVDRYGEWILLKPKPEGLNLMVWVLPVVLLISGGLFLTLRIKKWTTRP